MRRWPRLLHLWAHRVTAAVCLCAKPIDQPHSLAELRRVLDAVQSIEEWLMLGRLRMAGLVQAQSAGQGCTCLLIASTQCGATTSSPFAVTAIRGAMRTGRVRAAITIQSAASAVAKAGSSS